MSQDTNKRFLQLFTSMVEYLRPAPKLGIAWSGIGFVTLMVFLTIIGCTSDAQNIRATNEAAATPPATSTPLSAEIGWTEIRDGDCINSRIPEGIDIESVVIVPCSADWKYRALNSLTIEEFDHYPGESYFSRRAHDDCDRRYTFLLFPVSDSWALGHRTVTCLQESFGLSRTDPEKLDRLVGGDRLRAEECFNLAPESRHVSVELVDCTSEWQYRALNTFTVDDFDRYPGEALFGQRAYNECDRHFTSTSFPSADTWAAGARRVVCLQEGFGLSGTDPSKLDRLVNVSRLGDGECYNEAPETEYLLVEVVSCSGGWQYRTLNSYTVDDLDRYPGEGLFSQRAYKECDRRYTITLYPTADSWALGDRRVNCLQEGFGLSGNDPSKLGRLIGSSRLNVEECFNEAPETEYAMVELSIAPENGSSR